MTTYKSKMDLSRTLKKEYQPGGSDQAVKYIRDVPGLQQAKHWFCVNKLMMTETEYLECLNKAVDNS